MTTTDAFETEVYACVETYLRMRASDPLVAVQIMRTAQFSHSSCIAAAALMGLSRGETLSLCPTYRASLIEIVKSGDTEAHAELINKSRLQ